jgi:eukaryotic-like serine/threonine-protein kinase
MLSEGQRLSHYTLLHLLRSGGMGEVYLAIDTRLKRQVAIKIIHIDTLRSASSDAMKEAARLFLREAQAIAQLDHSNILPLYDSGEQIVHGISLMYMVMPYRQAGSLADWKCSHCGNQLLPLAAVEHIIEQAALALQHAHERQIIHQDVKPSNFLIQGEANTPGELHLQLADFGIARVMMTSESQVIRGTPTYMAPEQWDGRPVPATDQYALAVMAYEFLTGSPPFVGQNYQQMWHQHVHVDPSPLSAINPDLPQELDAVFLRALQKNPARRYSSVLAFAHAFQQAVLSSANVQQTLTISPLEARTGTNRVILLHNGRQVVVPIPPGVNHGQIIRLEGYGRPTTYNNPVGALIVTIDIAPVVAIAAISPTAQTFQPTIPAFNALAHNNSRPTLRPVPLNKRRANNIIKLLFVMMFILVLLGGGFGIYTATKNSDASGNKSGTVIPYPSYLPGKGIFALNDPMKDDSKGYSWNPPNYRFCNIQQASLHVHVFGDKSDIAHFHPCIGKTPIFSDFAFQVNMTILKGDCGGVVFRSNDPLLYYFYFCQNGFYGLVRYQDNKDPPKNLPLREGFSTQIKVGLNHTNMITVLVRGHYIYMYVNKIQIDKVYDTSYSKGKIGVLAKAFDEYRPTEVAFSDATVWKL